MISYLIKIAWIVRGVGNHKGDIERGAFFVFLCLFNKMRKTEVLYI